MKYGFIREQQKTCPVTALCAVMQVSTGAFYARAKTPISTAKQDRQNQLEARALELFEKNKKTYGARRLSDAFKKEGIRGSFVASSIVTIKSQCCLGPHGKVGAESRGSQRESRTAECDLR